MEQTLTTNREVGEPLLRKTLQKVENVDRKSLRQQNPEP